jgi:CRISPR-associated protein Cas2
MIVVSLTDCPPKLRGDLSKWLLEINTGVYVGNVSARVREELWNRICENLKNGRATMVFSTDGEQRMDFRIHNTNWIPVDYDGLKLIRRPLPGHHTNETLPDQFSKAAQRQIGRKVAASRERKANAEEYVAVDLETTGLSAQENEILELAAVRVKGGKIIEEWSTLVKTNCAIPKEITALTGITPELCATRGIPLKEALVQFSEFVQKNRIVCHNAAFDSSFLRTACQTCGLPQLTNAFTDTLGLARRKLDHVENYKLETIAAYFALDSAGQHRALVDSQLTAMIFEKLKAL